MVTAVVTNNMLDYIDNNRMASAYLKRNRLINFSITQDNYNTILQNIIGLARRQQSAYVCVANVHMFIEAHLSPAFAEVVDNAHIVTPDGMPLTWGLSLLYSVRQNRIAGMDLLPDLISRAEEEKLPVFVYGGTEAMQKKAAAFFSQHHQSLEVKGMYSPPFRPLTADEDEAVVEMINASGASIVLVCLGCPKQEKWMAAMQGKINAVMLGIGGALPVLVGVKKRAPLWMQKNGLEWFFRFLQEPGRLFRRYAYTNSVFIYLVAKEWFRLKLLRKNSLHTFSSYSDS